MNVMKLKTALFALVLMGSAHAQSEVAQTSLDVTVSETATIEVKVIETREACVFTIDPQWADEEDTRATKMIFDNYEATSAKLATLQRDGFEFAGYEGRESCTYALGASTFPLVRAADGSLYFSMYTTGATLARIAREQNAFKSVRRVYVKGFEALKQSLLKKVDYKKYDILRNL